jgi:hypothetical protein
MLRSVSRWPDDKSGPNASLPVVNPSTSFGPVLAESSRLLLTLGVVAVLDISMMLAVGLGREPVGEPVCSARRTREGSTELTAARRLGVSQLWPASRQCCLFWMVWDSMRVFLSRRGGSYERVAAEGSRRDYLG